jgi:DNA primase|uniref:DNA directed DNA polymerase n=1 Tax=Myoviridae sp. ctx322 TaxID=2826711 RepID=A0A8S5NA30_9CAUD|nr:MAG TPA: DNA directed DNA polymerase [Myoviridae sp. ctx322]
MAKYTSTFKGRLHQYFTVKLGAFDYRRGWQKCDCPYCGGKQKFGINLSTNRTNCFKCGEHPTPINLVLYLEHLDTYAEAYHLIQSNTKYEGYVFKEEKVELKEHKSLYLPEGFKLLNQGTSQLAQSARNYMRGRGFDIDELSKFGWGYGTSGKYFGYIIIPFHEKGQLVYFNARLFMGNGPRYNNPEVSESGLGKSLILYNKDALSMYRTVYICEGAINAATLGERAIASGGKAISRFQINEIIKSPVKHIIILLDPDAKGYAVDLALKLVNFKKVKVVFLPDGTDVNDLGKKATMRLVYSVHYQTYQELLQLKHSL